MTPNQYYNMHDKKQAIRFLQHFLREISINNRDYPTVYIDGIYGKNTTDVVKMFQELHDLPITGVMDSTTYNAIYREYNKVLESRKISQFRPFDFRFQGGVISKGDISDDVNILQCMLRRAALHDDGYFVELTGVYDDDTERAINNLQRHLGLAEVPYVDPIVYNHLIDLTNMHSHDKY